MRFEPLPISVNRILSRLALEGEDIRGATERRIAEKQRVSAELADARAEHDRLAKADRAGQLIKETRHGWDDDGDQIVKKVRDPSRLVAANARVDSLAWQLARLKDATAPVARLTLERANSELAKYAGKKLVPVERPRLPLAKAQSAAEALPQIRAQSLDALAERRAVSKAALTKEEVKTAMRRELGKLCDSGPPTILPMFHGAKIAWPQRNFGEGRYNVPDGVSLIAFLFRDELDKKLSELIDFNAAAFPDAMSAEEKADRLAELDAEIDALERVEAACVEQIIADGGVAFHRPDISILAVLSLRVD
ncbi:hypothetical protein [Bradyrhizobium sp. DOA1]|uniref:hypothetical protein n=1 Tax=Bradyrhizobium sp. DOA1 TaxID=1126616 RepID=UPI00077C2702|nr:hypothetical protein [Bradyrhizobium sp. DOA1]KYH02139.1 hypothetical protein SE91_30105 [Bradyrhizobium sp. DOA1]